MVRPTSSRTIVSRLFSASKTPIYLLDASRRIVFCNAALSAWVGRDEEQLLGLRCEYGDEQGGVAASLAVPPQVRSEPHYRGTITLQREHANAHRSASYIALQDRTDTGATLVIVDEQDGGPAEGSAFDVDSLHQQVFLLRQEWNERFSLDQLVGDSLAMRQVRLQVQSAIASPVRAVIVGNTGTGREALARVIHQERSQGLESLVALSCELLDAELLQSTIEDFIRQGAELASEELGTLLLLEVDQLSIDAQSALLGFMEIPELGLKTIATCRTPLTDLVAQKRFRPELTQHLNILEIRIPALTDRLADIPLLAQWLLEKSPYRERVGGFTPDAIEELIRYPWPREVVELREIVDLAAAQATGSLITKDDLPKKLSYAADALSLPDVENEDLQLDAFLAEVETELILRALGNAKGNRSQAARYLGISRGKLLRRLEQLGIESP